MPCATPIRFTPTIHSQSFSVCSQMRPPELMPALLNTKCGTPKRSTVARPIASTCSALETSSRNGSTLAPSASISAAALFSGSCCTSAITMLMPACAARREVSRPKPDAAPVMTAVLPWNVFMLLSLLRCLGGLDLEADAREVHHHAAGALVVPLDRDLVVGEPDQAACHRVLRVVGGGHRHLVAAGEALRLVEADGRGARAGPCNADRVAAAHRLVRAVPEALHALIPVREPRERRKDVGDRRHAADVPDRMGDRKVGDRGGVAAQKAPAVAEVLLEPAQVAVQLGLGVCRRRA